MDSSFARTFWRHAFVLFGGLLAMWAFIATVYIEFFRVPFPPCDFGQMGASCWPPRATLIPITVLGTFFAILGAVVFRRRRTTPERSLRPDAGMRLALAFLATLWLLPLVHAAVAANAQSAQGREELVRWGEFAYDAITVDIVVAVIGLVAFGSALGVHLYHQHLRRRYQALRRYEEERRARFEPPPLPRHGPRSRAPAEASYRGGRAVARYEDDHYVIDAGQGAHHGHDDPHRRQGAAGRMHPGDANGYDDGRLPTRGFSWDER